jgi:hypothetical protein
MRKTPSYLKGLAETRARAAGDVERYQQILEEVSSKLAQAKAEVAACDRLICKFDTRLNPELIEPIRAWKGRYGKRGQLSASIAQLLEQSAPEELTTTEVIWELQMQFQLDFSTADEKQRWRKNSLTPALKDLVSKGLVDRLHEPVDCFNGEVGRWRWKSGGDLSLDHLRAQAAAAGVSTQHADDAHE